MLDAGCGTGSSVQVFSPSISYIYLAYAYDVIRPANLINLFVLFVIDRAASADPLSELPLRLNFRKIFFGSAILEEERSNKLLISNYS